MYRTVRQTFQYPCVEIIVDHVFGIITHNTVHVETREMMGDWGFSSTLKCPLSPDYSGLNRYPTPRNNIGE